MEHYIRCPVLRRVGARRLGLTHSAADAMAVMMLATPRQHNERALIAHWIRVAVLHYALHRTINAARHHPSWDAAAVAERALIQGILEGTGN